MRRQTFSAKLDRLTEVMPLLREAAEAAGLDAARRDHLDLVVEEAFVNICRHSSACDVVVEVTHGDGEVTVELQDDGRPFDPTASKLPLLGPDLAERSPSGMGMTLVHTLADELSYRRTEGRNALRIILRRRPQP